MTMTKNDALLPEKIKVWKGASSKKLYAEEDLYEGTDAVDYIRADLVTSPTPAPLSKGDEEIKGVIKNKPLRINVDLLDTMRLAELFCAWPLPKSVCADHCATIQQDGRSGTNLLSVAEAKQFFDYLVYEGHLHMTPSPVAVDAKVCTRKHLDEATGAECIQRFIERDGC